MTTNGWYPGAPELGRGVVVSPGQSAAGFDGVRRVRIGPEDLVSAQRAAETLRDHYLHRRPVVVELDVDPAELTAPEICDDEPWRLDTHFTFWRERLAFYVWANNWDLRTGEPIWWWARKAARVAGPKAVLGGPADLIIGSTPVVVDGGPRGQITRLGKVSVWHREHVEAGVTAVERDRGPAEELSADQLEAVRAGLGANRIIAPAGAGKTRVLTARIRHLTADRGVDGSLICALAYNTKAAEEMRERLGSTSAQVRTVHSLAYSLLRDARGTVNVLTERDVRDRLRRLVSPPPGRDPLAPYLDALGQVRLGLRDPRTVEASRDDIPGFADAFGEYRAGLARDGVVDFDEQVYAAIEVLLREPRVRRAAQRRCRHLLVDEYQDLTPAFLLLVRLLAEPAGQLFAVGDDDQVIYQYLGADPRHLVEFDSWFPGAEHHALEVNWRCPADIVEAADRILSNNEVRVPKTIRAANTHRGMTVERVTDDDMASAAVDRIAAWLAEGRRPEDIAVLARVNSALLPVQLLARQRNIPVGSAVGRQLLDRTGVRTALTYLRLAGNSDWSGGDLAFVANRPGRRINAAMKSSLEDGGEWNAATLAALGAGARRLAGDIVTITRSGSDTVSRLAAISALISEDLAALDGTKESAGNSHADDLLALRRAAPSEPDPDRFEDWLAAQLSARSSGVTLASIHRTKGLEWPCVVLTSAAEPVLPHALVDDVEEERRLFHVAITRAREELLVLGDAGGSSPFLDELDGAPPIKVTARQRREQDKAAKAAAAPGYTRKNGSARHRDGADTGERTWGGRVTTRKVTVARTAGRVKSGSGPGLFSPSPASRNAGPRSVAAAVGLELSVPGGHSGVVEEVRADAVALRIPGGPLTTVRFGETVITGGKRATLTRP